MEGGLGRILGFGFFCVISLVGYIDAYGQTGARVTGTIVDVTGGIVTEASVRLFSLDQLRETESNDRGEFSFMGLSSGTYELQADSPGFDTTIIVFDVALMDIGPLAVKITSPGVPFHCGERAPATYELRHSKEIGLAGVVRDVDGGPLPEAKVIVSKPGHAQAFATQRADRKGNFQFRDLPPGKYTITVSTKGYRALEGETFWVTRGTLTKIALAIARNSKVFICM